MYLFNSFYAPEKREKPVKDTKQSVSKIQSRFVFHVEKCIGCHTCEVACAEQNNLPSHTAWRRVGEVEGGIFPDIKRYFVSLSCNHCLDAPCMNGCPASAYHVNDNGVVIHDDPKCIGCSYCTWNCPYGVPTFQKDRKIVTKCDMCSGRQEQNLQPACVEACPANAIEIEKVSRDDIWASFHENAAGPDMPNPNISIPSTKIVLPSGMNVEDFTKTNKNIIRPEGAHFSLIFMTVFTQLSVGGFLLSFIADVMRSIIPIPKEVFRSVSYLAPVLFGIAGLSLASSVLHLGRPALFFRAFINFKTSWLSREAIGFGMFSGLAFVYSGLIYFSGTDTVMPIRELANDSIRMGIGFLTTIIGVYGVYASSRIYRVPSRPAWNHLKTTFDFFNVTLLTGVPLFLHAAAVALYLQGGEGILVTLATSFSIFAVIFGLVVTLYDFSVLRYREESPVNELKHSVYLYNTVFYRENSFRLLLLGLASALTFMVATGYFQAGSLEYTILTLLVLVLYTVYALMTRFLFFVTVVPSNIPGNFIVEVNKPQRGHHV